jgi:hypothetical protein
MQRDVAMSARRSRAGGFQGSPGVRFFLFNHFSLTTYLDHGGVHVQSVSWPLSAVRAVAARCKLPFALRPGLSRECRERTEEMTKRACLLPFFRGRHEEGRGEKQRFLILGTQLLAECAVGWKQEQKRACVVHLPSLAV